MGLKYAYHGIDSFVPIISFEHDFFKKHYTVIFDGLFFIYSSYSAEMTMEDFLEKILNTIEWHLRRLIAIAPNNMRNFDAIFMLDGKSPSAKKWTQSHRKYIDMNVSQIKFQLKTILESSKGIKFEILDVGEVECEAFHQFKSPRLILTNDTDMFHIAYNYPKENENDIAIYATKNFNKIYDFSATLQTIDRNLMKFILFCSGTDYSDSLFTKTMYSKIIEHALTLKELKLPPIELFDIELLHLLAKLCIRLSFMPTLSTMATYLPKNRDGNDDLGKYFDNILWGIRYSNYGVRYIEFNSNFEYQKINGLRCIAKLFDIECNQHLIRKQICSRDLNALVKMVNLKSASLIATSNMQKEEISK